MCGTPSRSFSLGSSSTLPHDCWGELLYIKQIHSNLENAHAKSVQSPLHYLASTTRNAQNILAIITCVVDNVPAATRNILYQRRGSSPCPSSVNQLHGNIQTSERPRMTVRRNIDIWDVTHVCSTMYADIRHAYGLLLSSFVGPRWIFLIGQCPLLSDFYYIFFHCATTWYHWWLAAFGLPFPRS